MYVHENQFEPPQNYSKEDLKRLTEQLNKLRPMEDNNIRRTSAPGNINSTPNVSTNNSSATGANGPGVTGNRRYSEEYRDRNYRKLMF